MAPRRRDQLPGTVHIQLVDVVVSPSRADGAQWDGAMPAAPFGREVFRDVAFSSAPGTPWVHTWAGASPGGGRERPDPHGWADLAISGAWVAESARRWPSEGETFLVDTLAARFDPLEWRDVPFDAGTRLRVTVLDRDFPSDEMMGVAEIPFAALVRALEVGGVLQVPVGDQTDGQVMSVGVSVTPAR